ncbi:MAG: 50S ribosomal protein L23 [bacterium]|nr:MAG: 50S ribosomal protein L23 [bacterium]
MNSHSVIIRPLLTEKTIGARTVGGKYYFQIHLKANKIMVSRALENLFKVKVSKCNTYIMKGKKSKTRHGVNYRANWKKAIVTLKEGSFDFYEGI